MSRRESRNPVSGRRQLPRRLRLVTCFLLFLDAVFLLCFWSYHSCEVAGVFTLEGFWRIPEWTIYALQVAPIKMSASEWGDLLLRAWKPLLMIDLFFGLMTAFEFRKYGHFRGVEHGSAHWMTRKELRPFRPMEEDPGLPLAKNVHLTDAVEPANRNMFVLGAPGTGKSFTIIIPTLETLTRVGDGRKQASFFCTDTKGALFRDTCRMMRGRGIKTFLLNLSNPWYSDRYNPLYNIHEERKYTEISQLALAFVKNVRDEEASIGEDIWEKTAKAMIIAVWTYQYDFQRNPVTDRLETRALWRTAELVHSIGLGENGQLSSDGEFAQIIEAVKAIDPLHPAVQNYDFVTKGAGETIASVIFTVGSKIDTFTYPEIQSLTDGNDIPLDWICENPGGIYLNFEIGSPYRAIAALFIEQLFLSAYYLAQTKYNGRLPLDLQMCLDELPNICRVYTLPERLSTSRSYGINITVSVQSMQQLDRMYDKADETLKNNCVTHIYLGTGEEKALKYISEALGKTTTEEVDRSRNVGSNSSGGGSDSDKAIGRELALPDEIHSMSDKYAIIKIQHYQPIFAKKFPTAKQPWYPELGGQGCPENSCSIEDAYRIPSLIRQWQFYEQRLERIERIKEEKKR